MLSVALTGNIGSGKSTVAALFRRWGATLIDADALVREAQAPGGAALAEIQTRFGANVVRADGELDRAALRSRVLAHPEELKALNRIMHPIVHQRRRELLAEARARKDRIVVSDIPLLFEVGDPGEFDAIVLVDAPEPVRRQRIQRARGLDETQIDRLMAAQQPATAKRPRSDYVIENDTDLASLERSASEVWQALVARA